MPLPANVDLHAVTKYVSTYSDTALREWLEGAPSDETSFINHLTGQLSKGRRGCDVGLKSRMIVHSKVFELHRKGPKNTDRFGTDFAVTISFDPSGYTQTVLFQVKLGTDYSAELELDQLVQMVADPQIAPRAFLLYVNEDRLGIRIKSAKKLLDDFKPKTKMTQKYDATTWQSEAEWLLDWMKGKVGAETKLNSPNPIEATLAAYEYQGKKPSVGALPYPVGAWLVEVFASKGIEYDDTKFAAFFKQWQSPKTP